MPAMNSGQRAFMEPAVDTLRNQTSISIEINVFYAFRENLSYLSIRRHTPAVHPGGSYPEFESTEPEPGAGLSSPAIP
jgi:hypothetical protein